MHLQTVEPWIIVVAFGLLAVLCGHVAGLCGHIADLLHLYGLVCPDSALGARYKRWREQRRLYWLLSTMSAAAALTMAGAALGWW